MNILVMADEKVFAPYQRWLERERTFMITLVNDCLEGREFLSTYPYDLVIVVGGRKINDEINCIKWARDEGYEMPILIFADPAALQAKEVYLLLDSGADAIYKQGAGLEEFGAVARALMRRFHKLATSKIFIGSLMIDLLEHQVYANDHLVDLTNKEQAILECLVINKGRILSKEALLAHVYGGMDEPEIRIIDAFIWRIRKKLGDAGLAENYMQTVWGRGYRFSENSEVHPE